MPSTGGPIRRRRETQFHFGAGTVEENSFYMNLAPRTSRTAFSLGPPALGVQETVSEGHPWPPSSRKGLKDIGGNFSTSKTWVEGDNTPKILTRPRYRYFEQWSFNGQTLIDWAERHTRNITPLYPCSAADHSNQFPPASPPAGLLSLNEMGATAIARCKPTNSTVDIATTIGELTREGIPKMPGIQLWETRARQAKAAGSEYLNVEFGWLPLIRDIRGIAEAIRTWDKKIAQFERDAGKVVRRRYSFPLHQTTTPPLVVAFNRIPYGVLNSEITDGCTKGNVFRETSYSRKVWFSGAFTYHLPSGYDSRNRMVRAAAQADRVLGTNLTPETLWNLAPWSWAIDWFSNVGDVISNMSDMLTDGLVMHYGYVMEHVVSKTTYSIPDFRFKYDPAVRVPNLSFVRETKVRVQANPFGFGVTWEGLSPRQLAILVALGISRG